jgi:hypothetical protein
MSKRYWRNSIWTSYPTKPPMVVRSIDIKKDPFRPREEEEEILGPQVPYLSAIGALMYLANSTCPNIAFAVNLLARHSAKPTKRHWVGVKTILRYLNGTRDLGLFYSRNQDPIFFGIYRCWLFIKSPQWQITNRLCILVRWNNNILEVFKANIDVYFHQSF